MADTTTESGRPAQRRRTRKAILEAAAALLAEGAGAGGSRTPSVADIAKAADVSRRTIYQSFPPLEHLVLDATLGAIGRETIEAELDPASHADDIEARLDAVVRAVQRG